MNSAPLQFTWTGEALEPSTSWAAIQANKQFVVGERYPMEVHQGRSAASHNHQFAAITEAWKNLPDEYAERFPTAEHLRKYALIKGGYCEQRQIVCASKAEALRLAAFIKPMDTYALVTARDAVVTVYTAQSQSRKAMGGKQFQESKEAVLDYVAGLVSVSRDELERNAGQAA